jgi:hypothetical protein
MTTYYLIRGSQLVGEIDSSEINRISFPPLAGDDAMSLLNVQHANNLMANLDLTPAAALAALGIADLRSSAHTCVALASSETVQRADATGLVVRHLADVDATYSLWRVGGQIADLMRLHMALWSAEPLETLGVLAVVEVWGSTFGTEAVRISTGMTLAQAAARRDRIADYLQTIGRDTTQLRAATTEHTLVLGVGAALGYSAAQLWSAMVKP